MRKRILLIFLTVFSVPPLAAPYAAPFSLFRAHLVKYYTHWRSVCQEARPFLPPPCGKAGRLLCYAPASAKDTPRKIDSAPKGDALPAQKMGRRDFVKRRDFVQRYDFLQQRDLLQRRDKQI